MARDNVAFMEYANSQIAMRKDAEAEALISGEPHRKDFMYYLLSASDKETGKGLTKTELDADSGLLISAGADTTSITLAALLFYLIHNPRALHRAVHEIRTTFPSSCFSVEDIVSGPRLNSLTYTRSCIEEALRLSPPVPTHLPRQVLPGGLTISGHFLPQGTIVGTSAYAIHHNPEYYPDPFAFKPERWIVDDKAGNDIGTTAESVATAKAAFCAFSLGTRGCIGKSLAYMEMMLAIARLLWLFDMEKAEPPCGKSAESNEGSGASAPWLTGEGDPSAAEGGRRRIDEYQLWDRFLSAREGPMVRFRRVDGRIMEDRM